MNASLFHGSPEKFKKIQKPSSGKNYGSGVYLTEDIQEAYYYSLTSDKDGFLYEVELDSVTSSRF